MFRKLGIFADTIVARVVNTQNLRNGQYGLYGNIQIVIDTFKKQKNPNAGQPGEQQFISQRGQEFYFVGIGGIKNSLKQGLTVGDIVVIKFTLGQFHKEGEKYPRHSIEAKELLYHVRKQEIDCLKKNGLIADSQQRQGTASQPSHQPHGADTGSHQNHQPLAPQQQSVPHQGQSDSWGQQRA